MTELELEAYKYNKNASINELYLNKSFIAGATSKYVEKQKLELLIEENKSILNMLKLHSGD